MKKKKVIFYILDFIVLILSYILCDYLTLQFNITIGIIIGLFSYMGISLLLRKAFKIK